MELKIADKQGYDQQYKFDGGKLRWDLMPFETLEGAVRVLMFGAKKYAAWSFMNVRPYRSRYFAALLRHMFAWWSGEQNDPETGESHLYHAMCCLIFLIYGEVHEIKED